MVQTESFRLCGRLWVQWSVRITVETYHGLQARDETIMLCVSIWRWSMFRRARFHSHVASYYLIANVR